MKNFDPNLLSFLKEHNLWYKYFEHPPIFTVEQWEALKQSLPGKQTKNLFLTDKRGHYFLVCIESPKRLAINEFRKLVGSRDMTFWTPEEMYQLLKLTPWSVSIFGLIHKPEQLVLYIDQDLWNAEQVGRHPNRNDATIIITHDMLENFLCSVGYKENIITI